MAGIDVADGLGLALEGLGQQADGRQRRPELVRQVVDELGPDALQTSQLGDVVQHEPHVPTRQPAGADGEDRAIGTRRADLAGRRPGLDGVPGQALDRRIEEGLHDRPADEAPGLVRQHRVGPPVGVPDMQAGVDPDDPGVDGLVQRRVVGRSIADDPLALGILIPQAMDRRERSVERAASPDRGDRGGRAHNGQCHDDEDSRVPRGEHRIPAGGGAGPVLGPRARGHTRAAARVTCPWRGLPTARSAGSGRPAMGPRGARTPRS